MPSGVKPRRLTLNVSRGTLTKGLLMVYSRINGEARIFSRPTSQIKIDDLDRLIEDCEEEKLPETVRYPEPLPTS